MTFLLFYKFSRIWTLEFASKTLLASISVNWLKIKFMSCQMLARFFILYPVNVSDVVFNWLILAYTLQNLRFPMSLYVFLSLIIVTFCCKTFRENENKAENMEMIIKEKDKHGNGLARHIVVRWFMMLLCVICITHFCFARLT